MSTPSSFFFIGLSSSIILLLLVNYCYSLYRRKQAFSSIRKAGHSTQPLRNKQLPPCVENYLLVSGANNINTAKFCYAIIDGQFRRNERTGWQNLHARVLYHITTPALAWFGYFGSVYFHALTALLTFRNGRGISSLMFFHSIPLLRSGGYETETSLLSRYVSEAVWFPLVFADSRYFEWESLSEFSASLTFSYHHHQIHATVYFRKDGFIQRITINDKFRDFKGFFEKQNFHFDCDNYQNYQGVTVPTNVGFIWETNDGDFPYAQLHLTSLIYSR